MANGIDFPEANFTFGPPRGMTEDEVKSLRVFTMGEGANREIISKWQLSEAELSEVRDTGVIWLYVCGDSHPPVFITGSYPFLSEMDTRQLKLPL